MLYLFVVAAIIGLSGSATYAFKMFKIRQLWDALPVFISSKDSAEVPVSISIIIPVRNEAENIENCLTSILRQNYPKQQFQVVIVDDHSTDLTKAKISAFIERESIVNYTLLTMPSTQSGKKAALAMGINHTQGELIVTTDADCIYHPNWIKDIAAFYAETKAKVIIGKVELTPSKELWTQIQEIELKGLTMVAGALAAAQKPMLANGANFAYERSAFELIGGFDGIGHISSGDDVLLLNKFKNTFTKEGDIRYLKCPHVQVHTRPQTNWYNAVQQRLRWVSKTKRSKNNATQNLALTMGAGNLSPLLGTLLIPYSLYTKQWEFIPLALLIIGIKSLADFYLLKSHSIGKLIIAQQIYSIMIVELILRYAISKPGRWKGRQLTQ